MSNTYRLQLHAGFTFADAESRLPYLATLGVTHLYLSPVLQAAAGSSHGYDVVDHGRINRELGGESGLVQLAETARAHGLGLIVDVVPNHMALVAPEHANPVLWQVLRDGPSGPTAHWFDVDWDALDGRFGLPVLGAPVEEVIASGELLLDRHDDEPVLRYHDHAFPLAPGTEGEDVTAVLEAQHYRLGSWRDRDRLLNYRRFFDVAELVAIRVELPDVFDATHALLLDLNHRGVIEGFRIDHPDGLADPEGYLRRLRGATRPGTGIWVEKILEGEETLPASWPCDGTTGYDALRAVTASLVDQGAATRLQEDWERTGGAPELHPVVAEAKRQVVDDLLGPEVARLTRRAHEALPDADPARLAAAVVELLVAAEVYRAYVRPGEAPDPLAVERLESARDRGTSARPDLEAELGALADLVLVELASETEGPVADLAVRLQQTWGPVMAKGVEDTTFYRWHRLVALNEVGGDPGLLETGGPDVLHAWAARQQRDRPWGMTTLSTHDTKRSEDVRARLLAVAEDTEGWGRCSTSFAEASDDAGVDRATGHLLWQTMVGVGSISDERMHGYLTKAVREAKQHTGWTAPDEEYEQRVHDLAATARRPGDLRRVVDELVWRNRSGIRATVLAQKLLQLTLPGTADTYQGTELVDLSLVDPDNRRPVDLDERARRLARLDRGEPPADLDDEKLLVVSRALRLRRELRPAFADGGYEPVGATSPHALGFLRGGRVLTVTTRLPRGLAQQGGWRDHVVALPPGAWRDELTGRMYGAGETRCAELFETLPVALLAAR